MHKVLQFKRDAWFDDVTGATGADWSRCRLGRRIIRHNGCFLLNESFYAKVRIDFEHGGIIVAIKDGIADDRLNLYVDACVFIRSVDMFNRSFKIFLFN